MAFIPMAVASLMFNTLGATLGNRPPEPCVDKLVERLGIERGHMVVASMMVTPAASRRLGRSPNMR
ncbi:hypothetical protein FHR32_003535 [Streptosporangium album]|uniref:Uncharacterized protein n=1 Tax=Streptosporangium album TaxID=47479 RepID=A0A7W7RW26_9ACTN|nr:hypothetical protein [Streptosporangium album]